ncbi:MAG: hypothetical protein ACTSRF_13405, partial [Candidatus Freyarchaeota archaeon]
EEPEEHGKAWLPGRGTRGALESPAEARKRKKINFQILELRKNFYRRRGVRIPYLKIVRGILLVGGN